MPRGHILVVDDSPTILKLVQLVLTKAEFQVTTAADGAGALAAARAAAEATGENGPDLVLLDDLLPDMDGKALCLALAQDQALTKVPVVLMGAKQDDLTARQLANVIDAIAKPFTPEALIAVVGHALEKTRAADPVPETVEADLGSLSLLPETRDPDQAAPSSAVGIPENAALVGDMAVIAVADVFSLLQGEGQTGVLGIAHEGARLRICFRQGRIDFATAEGVSEDFLLGRFLVKTGALSDADLAEALEERRRGEAAAGTLLGAELILRGLVTPAGLKKAVSFQTAALVFESLRWGAGRFWFEATTDLPETAREAALGLGVDALLMEGFRRIDEWRLIEREIGTFDTVFVRDEERLAAFGRGKLTREELAVLESVNGKNSVREIVQVTQMGSFDTAKMLYRLLRTKLIRRRVTAVAV